MEGFRVHLIVEDHFGIDDINRWKLLELGGERWITQQREQRRDREGHEILS